jgi:RHS repeat-associated protein
MYIGQERQEDLGLNWDSFRYRNYDVAIGRFFGVDPISEKYYYLTNYQFAHNNPVWKIELEGLEGAPTQGEDVINTKVPDDVKVHATIDAKATINFAIDHIGNKIGYANLSEKLETSHADEVYKEVLKTATNSRGTKMQTTNTNIGGDYFWEKIPINIKTEISSISIINPDNINANSSKSNGDTRSDEGSVEVGGGKEGGVNGKVGYKTAKESTVEGSDGVSYNMYTAKIYLTVTVRTTKSDGTPVAFRSVVSVMGSISTTMNFQTSQELK